jgi:hypothetical protein
MDKLNNTYDVDKVCERCTFPKFFWHTNHTIFYVNINYMNEFIGMVSFSNKNKVQWWEQGTFTNDFWKLWDPVKFMENTNIMLFVAKKRKELIDKLIEKATKIYIENK